MIKVKDILDWYVEGGTSLIEENLKARAEEIDPMSWANHIKTSIEKKLYQSVSCEIELLLYKLRNLR